MLELYKNIKKRRTELGISQQELAESVGYKGKSMISQVEKGLVDISSTMISRFATALNCTESYLMGWDDEEVAELLNVSDRSDFKYSLTDEEVNLLKKIRVLEDKYSISEIERGLEFIALYQNAIPEIQTAIQGLLKSQKHDP